MYIKRPQNYPSVFCSLLRKHKLYLSIYVFDFFMWQCVQFGISLCNTENINSFQSVHTHYAFYKVQIFYHLRDIKVAIMPSGNPFKFAEAV